MGMDRRQMRSNGQDGIEMWCHHVFVYSGKGLVYSACFFWDLSGRVQIVKSLFSQFYVLHFRKYIE